MARAQIVLPWSMVMHDNHRLMPVIINRKPRLITAPDYRQAKAQAEYEIKRQWRQPALHGAVILHARAYFPNLRKRDCGNYRKLVTDAMSGICYADDAQLSSETWERAGVSKDNPRIEINLGGSSVSEIKPALTVEEWDLYLPVPPEEVRSLDADLILHDDGPQALAALCLYGQPFGFTHEDVRLLRGAAHMAEFGSDEGADIAERDRLNSLADRIEALLPPKP